jgi:hydroxyethylthiazole kinase-like uncharacterized protein yjeF
MIEAYAVSHVRAAEAAAVAALDAQGLDGADVLMQRAAGALADVAEARLRERRGRRALALVGGGNNGGDALFALARLARKGYAATAVIVAEAAHERGLKAAVRRGATAYPAGSGQARDAIRRADLILDGITGIGGRPGLSTLARDTLDAIPDSAYLLAVDLPSGADPAGTAPLGAAAFADETVTFAGCKPVHLLPATAPAIGRLTVVDIGVQLHDPVVARLTRDDVGQVWRRPTAQDDKYSRGVVGVVAGSASYPGAAVLCTLGALGAGPGMVRYHGPDDVRWLVLAGAPEAVAVAGAVQAWVVGPGLDPADTSAAGTASWALVDAALDSPLPVVVDAGALDRFRTRPAPTLLTPHAGEAARLLTRIGGRSVSRAEVEADRLGSARRLADLTAATVLLKGSTTLVVPPQDTGRPVWCQAEAPPSLATAGSGDVLSGLIGTLIATGHDLDMAAALGTLVHGIAASDVGRGGPVRPTALAHQLPGTVAALLAGETVRGGR